MAYLRGKKEANRRSSMLGFTYTKSVWPFENAIHIKTALKQVIIHFYYNDM